MAPVTDAMAAARPRRNDAARIVEAERRAKVDAKKKRTRGRGWVLKDGWSGWSGSWGS